MFATVLSWLSASTVLLCVLGGILDAVLKPFTTRDRIFRAWIVLCTLALTPARYMLFQVVAAVSYPWQSIRAFLSSIVLSIYVPIIFVALTVLAVGIPIFVAKRIAGTSGRSRMTRLVLAAVAFPILCLLGSWFYFSIGLPLSARSVHWLHPGDVLRAANGPTYLVFKFAMPLTPLSFPVPGDQLPGSDLALLRLHVASTYMNARKEAWVLMTAYPDLYRRVYRQR
jgi:hypothetical protein